MTPGRMAAYIGGAVVLAAWFAAAASAPRVPSEPGARADAVATSGTERLAADVQAQSVRLRQRLAAAPSPQAPRRNPFMFGEREAPAPRAATQPRVAPAPAPLPVFVPREPELSLAGIAEQESAKGPVRTAMIVGPGDELFLLTVGDTVAGRYTVSAIGADAVELQDSTTGLTRRLALR